jgi:hypothetical protein
MGGGIRSLESWTEDKQTRNLQQLHIKWDAQIFLDATTTMTTSQEEIGVVKVAMCKAE